jgi:hypothetical protein
VQKEHEQRKALAAIVAFNVQAADYSVLEKKKPASGTPKGNRTPVCAVKGRCPNR